MIREFRADQNPAFPKKTGSDQNIRISNLGVLIQYSVEAQVSWLQASVPIKMLIGRIDYYVKELLFGARSKTLWLLLCSQKVYTCIWIQMEIHILQRLKITF